MADPQTLIERAEAEVDAVDWDAWTPHPVDTVLMLRVFSGVPPLTRWMVSSSVDFRTWLAGRPASAEDHTRAEQEMVGKWLMSDQEGAYIRDVLVALAVRQALLELSAEEREAVRAPLRARFEESPATSTPSSEGGPTTPPEGRLAEHMRSSALQHQMFLNTLRNM